MRRLVTIIASCALLAACSHSTASKSPNEQLAADQGRFAAMEVLKHKSGTMARERAILNIRATEEKILHTGDTAAARAYIGAAKEVLDSIL